MRVVVVPAAVAGDVNVGNAAHGSNLRDGAGGRYWRAALTSAGWTASPVLLPQLLRV